MTEKPCTGCGTVKPLSAFGTKPTWRVRSRCRECWNAAHRAYYWEDVEMSRLINRMRYAEKKQRREA